MKVWLIQLVNIEYRLANNFIVRVVLIRHLWLGDDGDDDDDDDAKRVDTLII